MKSLYQMTKYNLIIAIGLLLLSLLNTPDVFAQDAGIEWDALNQEALKLYQAGKFERAVVLAQKAL